VKRVNWLRAKARYSRWSEELQLVKHEMKWTIAWFSYQQRVWKKREEWATEQGLLGHGGYATKQVLHWTKMIETNQECWKDINN
jgi:hypothetical protein